MQVHLGEHVYTPEKPITNLRKKLANPRNERTSEADWGSGQS
jgi:hypothetical protein